MSEAVDDGLLLTVQNPAEMIGETVIDCRPSVLPVSIPLCALSPGTVADFSSDEEEPQVEQFPSCRCEGRIEYMEWDSDDMTDSEDSEWEYPEERANRLWVEQYNYDLIEGMTLMTYTPPPRTKRRRRYEDRVKCVAV